MTQKYLLEYKYFPADNDQESGRFGQYVAVYSYTFTRSDSTEKQLEVVKACLGEGDVLVAAWAIDWKDLAAKHTVIYSLGKQPDSPDTKMLGRIRQQYLNKNSSSNTSSVYKPNVVPVTNLPAVVKATPASPTSTTYATPSEWTTEPVFRLFPYPIAAKAAGAISES